MKGIRLLVALSAAVLTIVASPARAQSAGDKPRAAPQQAAPKAAPGKKAAPQQKTGARRVVRVEEMRVEGRVQKPQAMFLMPRANVSAGEKEQSESFVSQVKSAAEKDPF